MSNLDELHALDTSVPFGLTSRLIFFFFRFWEQDNEAMITFLLCCLFPVMATFTAGVAQAVLGQYVGHDTMDR